MRFNEIVNLHEAVGVSRPNKLTRNWIQYLKNNQITALKSDPNSGKLTYKRKANTNDLIHFLDSETDIGQDAIIDAIQSVLTKKNPNAEQPDRQSQEQPGIEQGKKQLPTPTQQIAHDPNSVSDIDSKDVPLDEPEDQQRLSAPQKAHGGKKPGEQSQTPGAIRKRSARSAAGRAFGQMQKHLRKSVNEAFTDQPTDLDEKDVEEVLSAVQSQIDSSGQDTHQPAAPEEDEAPQKSEIDKLKNLIKSRMSAAHRKELWQALQGSTLHENTISDEDELEQVFKYASKTNNKLNIDDLRKAWVRAGRPTDSGDISSLLHKFGFSGDQINQVFYEVWGDEYDGNSDESNSDEEQDSTGPSQAVAKIAEYIKKHNLQDEIIAYMQQEFGDELNQQEPEQQTGWMGKAMDFGKKLFGKKTTTEEVRQIFTKILLHEQIELPMRIKEQQKNAFGRNKK